MRLPDPQWSRAPPALWQCCACIDTKGCGASACMRLEVSDGPLIVSRERLGTLVRRIERIHTIGGQELARFPD